MTDFDIIIDREHDKYSYSSKWDRNGFAKYCFGDGEVPLDRIPLHVADMDFKCPPAIIEELENTAKHGIFGYSTPSQEYYDSIIRWYKDRFNTNIAKAHIYHSHGTHKAIEEAIKRVTSLGDEVIVLTPSYSYHNDIEGIGRKFKAIEMINDNNYYKIDFDAFEDACKKAKAFVLCNPHNPTGRIFSDEELVNLAYICRFHGVTIITDEVHGDIVRKDQKFHPLISVVGPKGIITCNAVNKTFNLAGLASSYIIIEDEKLNKLFSEYYSAPSPFEISATIAAYTNCDSWVDELNEYLDNSIKECVDYIHTNLPKAKVIYPQGTYIIWVDFSEYKLSDKDLRDLIYNGAHVVGQGGSHYDNPQGEQFQRFCIASRKDLCLEAFKRIAKVFKSL